MSEYWPDDLRDSVRDWRNPATTEAERQTILEYWAEQGVKNQLHALALASRIEKGEADV